MPGGDSLVSPPGKAWSTFSRETATCGIGACRGVDRCIRFRVFQSLCLFLSSIWKSLLVLVLAVGAWFLWKLLFRKLFEISQTIREQYPDLANR